MGMESLAHDAVAARLPNWVFPTRTERPNWTTTREKKDTALSWTVLPALWAGLLSEAWSNGPVEGRVNRLKLIKRSMSGRAAFALLNARLLHAG